jgi:HlyD family secretion protein
MKGFAVICVVALLGTASYWYTRPIPEAQVPVTFAAEKRDVTIKLSVLGELRALNSAIISAQIDVPIIYLAPEGTHVQKGDLLVSLDPSKYEVALAESRATLQVTRADQQKAEKDLEAQSQKLLAEVARFEAEVALAQLDLEDLKKKPLPDELEKARFELEKAKTAFDYAEKRRNVLPDLVDKGYITKETLEEAELRYVETKANLQSAKFTFDKVAAGATRAELDRVQLRLKQAQFALNKAQSGMQAQLQAFEATVEREQANVERAKSLIETAKVRLRRTELRAPQEGLVVYARVGGEKSGEKVQLGSIPFEGQPILYLPDLSSMVVDTEVNEIDIGKIKKGGPVEIRLDTYPDTVFQGKILHIGSLAQVKRGQTGTTFGVKVFDVTVQIEGKDPRLKPGLTANLDIIVDRQQDVISVPLSAVVSHGGEHVVFVIDASKPEERKVVLGPSNAHNVIVMEGLRPGELVLLDPSPLGRL